MGARGTTALSWALAAAAVAAVACARSPAPAAPSPATATVEATAATEGTPLSELPLATGGSCEERRRARPLCLAAMEAQCRSQRTDCESACEPRAQPGSSEKEPALRGDIEAEQCRQGCRQAATGCDQALRARCPRPCDADAGR